MLAFAIVAAAAGCQDGATGVASTKQQRSALTEHQLDLLEKMYRTAFRDDGYTGVAGKTYYLHLEGGDPPKDLLQRFGLHSPPVKPASEAPPGSMFHFHVYSVEWSGTKAAKITVGHRFDQDGELLYSRVPYRAERKGDIWQVVELPGGVVS